MIGCDKSAQSHQRNDVNQGYFNLIYITLYSQIIFLLINTEGI